MERVWLAQTPPILPLHGNVQYIEHQDAPRVCNLQHSGSIAAFVIASPTPPDVNGSRASSSSITV